MYSRSKWSVSAFSLAAIAAMAVAVGQPSAPPPERGRELALHVCSACHMVAKDQQFSPLLNPPAPSFMQIANRPGMQAEALRHFVKTTHWDEKTLPLTMPNPRLTDLETAEVAKYIMSLRSP
jgi:mono/diheme cytochrome c family protein